MKEEKLLKKILKVLKGYIKWVDGDIEIYTNKRQDESTTLCDLIREIENVLQKKIDS